MARINAEQSLSLETKPVGRLLWEFAAPAIIAMSASSIYNFCDSIFVGQNCGPLAIAGMTVTFPIMNILTAFCIIASIGGATLSSIYMGRKDQNSVLHVLGNVLLMNLAFGLCLMVVGWLFLDPILRAFGASDATLPFAKDYIQIILSGILVTHILQSLLGILRSTGYPRAAMRFQLLAVVLNILLDILFICVFGWGIRGAALATVLGQAVSLIIVLPRFFNHDNYAHFSPQMFHFRWHLVREIMSVGIAPFLANLCGCFVVMVINLSLLKFGNDLYLGANGIVNRITQLIIMMVAGFSQGLQPIVGYNLGAGRMDRVKQALHWAIAIATCIMTVGYVLIALFPQSLASLFTEDAAMIDACAPALRISLISFPLLGSQLIAVAYFQSIKKAKFSMLISLSRQLLCLLPLLLLLPSQWGIDGVWWSMAFADGYSILLTWYLLWRNPPTKQLQ